MGIVASVIQREFLDWAAKAKRQGSAVARDLKEGVPVVGNKLQI